MPFAPQMRAGTPESTGRGRLSLYAQAGYQFALGGTDGGKRDGVKGNLGLRYT
jgi:hypothetical protein